MRPVRVVGHDHDLALSQAEHSSRRRTSGIQLPARVHATRGLNPGCVQRYHAGSVEGLCHQYLASFMGLVIVRTSGTSSTASVGTTINVAAMISVASAPRISTPGPASASPSGASASDPRLSYALTRESASGATCVCSAVFHSTPNT